jgi:hypothetical protein
LPYVEFDFLPLGQVIEFNAAAGRHVKKQVLITAIAGLDEAEAPVCNTLDFAFTHIFSILFFVAKENEICTN